MKYAKHLSAMVFGIMASSAMGQVGVPTRMTCWFGLQPPRSGTAVSVQPQGQGLFVGDFLADTGTDGGQAYTFPGMQGAVLNQVPLRVSYTGSTVDAGIGLRIDVQKLPMPHLNCVGLSPFGSNFDCEYRGTMQRVQGIFQELDQIDCKEE